MADLRTAFGEEVVDTITGPAAAATTGMVLIVAAFFLVAQVWSHRRYVGAALRLAGLLTAMLGLALGIHSRGWVSRTDTATSAWFVAHRSAGWTVAASAITDLGNPVAIAAATLISAALLCWRARSTVPGIVVIGTVSAAALASTALKALIDRPRPPREMQLVIETDPSFPSGHVTGTAALLGIVAICIGIGHSRTTRAWLTIGVVTGVLIIALTRLYLGVHWLSDVAAGATLAAASITVGATALRAQPNRPHRRSSRDPAGRRPAVDAVAPEASRRRSGRNHHEERHANRVHRRGSTGDDRADRWLRRYYAAGSSRR